MHDVRTISWSEWATTDREIIIVTVWFKQNLFIHRNDMLNKQIQETIKQYDGDCFYFAILPCSKT